MLCDCDVNNGPDDHIMCANTLTVCNHVNNAASIPLRLDSHVHIIPSIHDDIVSIYLPQNIWEDVLSLIS